VEKLLARERAKEAAAACRDMPRQKADLQALARMIPFCVQYEN